MHDQSVTFLHTLHMELDMRVPRPTHEARRVATGTAQHTITHRSRARRVGVHRLESRQRRERVHRHTAHRTLHAVSPVRVLGIPSRCGIHISASGSRSRRCVDLTALLVAVLAREHVMFLEEGREVHRFPLAAAFRSVWRRGQGRVRPLRAGTSRPSRRARLECVGPRLRRRARRATATDEAHQREATPTPA